MDSNLLWTALAAIGTCATALIAWYQIGAIKRQQQGWETLRICGQYDTDPVLDRALCEIRKAPKLQNGERDYTDLHLEIVTVLNYFETIATGVLQHFYDDGIVRSQLEDLMRGSVAKYLDDKVLARASIKRESYPYLHRLLKNWNADRALIVEGMAID